MNTYFNNVILNEKINKQYYIITKYELMNKDLTWQHKK